MATLCFDQYCAPLHAKHAQYGDPIDTIQKALDLDGLFIMGHVMRGLCYALGTIPPSACEPLAESLRVTWEIINSSSAEVHPRERKHVLAFHALAEGRMKLAAALWEELLIEHPQDLLALKCAHDIYFYLGESQNIRDSVARVYKFWERTFPESRAFGYIMGMYAFGLEETSLYEKAEKIGREAVSRCATDTWAVHAVTHVMEMQGRQRDGLQWLADTQKDWEGCGGLARHNHWHSCLFHMELENYEKILEIFDTKIWGEKSSGMLDLVDASSLLWRLDTAGVKVGRERWDSVTEMFLPYLEHHVTAFNDLHLMMCALGSHKTEISEKILQSMQDYCESEHVTSRNWKEILADKTNDHSSFHLSRYDTDITQLAIAKNVGIPLAQALQDHACGRHDDMVRKIMPVRYHVQTMGGSHAQRDLIEITLVRSSLLSSHNHKLAQNLLSERTELKPTSPQSWRWFAEALQLSSASSSSSSSSVGPLQKAQQAAQHKYKSLL